MIWNPSHRSHDLKLHTINFHSRSFALLWLTDLFNYSCQKAPLGSQPGFHPRSCFIRYQQYYHAAFAYSKFSIRYFPMPCGYGLFLSGDKKRVSGFHVPYKWQWCGFRPVLSTGRAEVLVSAALNTPNLPTYHFGEERIILFFRSLRITMVTDVQIFWPCPRT